MPNCGGVSCDWVKPDMIIHLPLPIGWSLWPVLANKMLVKSDGGFLGKFFFPDKEKMFSYGSVRKTAGGRLTQGLQCLHNRSKGRRNQSEGKPAQFSGWLPAFRESGSYENCRPHSRRILGKSLKATVKSYICSSLPPSKSCTGISHWCTLTRSLLARDSGIGSSQALSLHGEGDAWKVGNGAKKEPFCFYSCTFFS